MKAVRVLIRNIRDAFKSVSRNFSLSFASITCSTITLLLVAFSLILSYNVKYLTKQYEDELAITVYINREATEEDLNNFVKVLDSNKDIASHKYMSKEDWKKMSEDQDETLNNALNYFSENPLLDSYDIKVNEVSKLSKVANALKKEAIVESIDFDEGFVNKVIVIFDIIKKVSIGIVLALVLVTAFLINNTIKLTIFSRRTEIEIMRLVGTSNTVIKLPFIIEGFILGVLGSLIPIVIAVYSYLIIFDRTGGYFYGNLIKLVKPFPFIWYVSLIVVGIGALVGMIGSYNAVRKYLKI